MAGTKMKATHAKNNKYEKQFAKTFENKRRRAAKALSLNRLGTIPKAKREKKGHRVNVI